MVPAGWLELAHVNPVDSDTSGVRFVQSREQLDQRGLACTVFADDGQRLACLNGRVKVLEDRPITTGIGERYVFEANVATGKPSRIACAGGLSMLCANCVFQARNGVDRGRSLCNRPMRIVVEAENSGGEDRLDDGHCRTHVDATHQAIACGDPDRQRLGPSKQRCERGAEQPALSAGVQDAAQDCV